MELNYKTILIALIAATFLPNVSPCWYDEESDYDHRWSANNELCGTKLDNGKIVGGADVSSTDDWPWLGFMEVNGPVNGVFRCTVELISWNWATTAAHCVDGGTQAGDLTLTFGQVKRDTSTQNSQQRDVQQIIIHPQYSRINGIYSDIALLRLSSPLTYTSFIRPVCMKSPDTTNDHFFNNCWVAGWGRLSTGGAAANHLQELSMTLELDLSVCEASWGDWLDDSHLCATRADGTGTCHGDSGGPLMCKSGDKQWVLFGITSFGSSSGCASQVPDGFTRVSSFSKWIVEEVDDHYGP